MITDFRVCKKTKRPACCDFYCCGNAFGRIEKRYYKGQRAINRIVKTRRYAKHVENQKVRKEIALVKHIRSARVREFHPNQ